MKKLMLGSVALAMLVAGPAFGADLAVKAPIYKAPPLVPQYSWTGCFIGGNGGGLWARKKWSDDTPGSITRGQSYGSHNADSWLVGVQAGCDYQFGRIVIGIQGDYDWTDARGNNVNTLFPTVGDESRIRSLGSVTGRIGYTFDRFLAYVRGGGAWERDNYDFYTVSTGLTAATARETRGGWTLGIGGEYAFTQYISGFVEYDHYDFGDRDNNFITPSGTAFTTTNIRESKDVVKAGLNLRWGYGGPVVARY